MQVLLEKMNGECQLSVPFFDLFLYIRAIRGQAKQCLFIGRSVIMREYIIEIIQIERIGHSRQQ